MNPSAFLAGIVGLATTQKAANQINLAIRQSIAQLIGAINQNTNAVLVAHGKPYINFPTPSTGGGGSATGGADKPGRTLLDAASAVAKFRLGVMAAADAMTRFVGNASPDAVGLVNDSFTILKGTIAKFLMPAILTFAAGVLATAEKLDQVLGVAFGPYAHKMGVLTTVLATLIDVMMLVVKAGLTVWECFLMGGATLGRVFGLLDKKGWENNRQASWDTTDKLWGTNVGGHNTDRKSAGSGDTKESMGEYLKMLIGDLQTKQGMRGNTGFSGIADVWKTIQQNSFKTSMEAMQLAVTKEGVGYMRRAAESLERGGRSAFSK